MEPGVCGPPHLARRGRHRGRAWRLVAATALAVWLPLTGCTWSREEPGFFRTEPPSPPPAPLPPIRPTNPQLPVAGEAVWTTGEGLRVTIRYAVHAVRRIEGGTVLDWSVTPLSAPRMSVGQVIPSWVDVGLTRQGQGDVNIVLIDPASKKVYRPLNHRRREQFSRCLCTPLWVAQLDLRIGDTRLLQVTYPELPTSLAAVDVRMTTLPLFHHVPVTPAGEVPTARRATNLQRPAADSEPLAPPYVLVATTNRGKKRVQSIRVDAISTTPDFTTMEWTLRALADQPNFALVPPGKPVAADVSPDVFVVTSAAASGPQLQVGSASRSALWMTAKVQDRGYYECLCTALDLWARSLRQAGGTATVSTIYPALPAGTRTVDVVLPGATTLWRLPVRPAVDASRSLGPAAARSVGSWTYRNESPPRGWGTAQWPTPIPDSAQLSEYEGFVESITPLPSA